VLRLSALAAAVTTLAVLIVAPAATAKVSRDFVGITSEDVFAGDTAYRSENLQRQSALGIGLLRQTFDWAAIEKAPGQYDLSYHDEYVTAAAVHGITILPILFRAPDFHLGRRHARYACPPASNASLAAFAQVLVQRYGQYWCNKPNAKQYVGMLKTVGGAINRADKGAHIVTAGLPPSKLGNAVPLEKFLGQMYKAKAAKYFDSLAINSYAKDQRELATLLTSVRALMNKSGDRAGKIWITELGWGDKGPRHRFVVGEKGQAKRIAQSLAYVKAQRKKLKLRGIVYFSWRDGAPYAPEFKDMWGLHTGLLDVNGAPKKAFESFGQRLKALVP
jgi:hypothetical protein